MKHLACKVRQRFTLIIVCAIRQNEVASAPGTAEASARCGQAAPGREAARGSSHGAAPAWAGILEAQWGMPDNLTSAVSSASSCCSPSQPKLLGVCTPHAPSQPCGSLHSAPTSGCPQGCSQTSAPSVWIRRQSPCQEELVGLRLPLHTVLWEPGHKSQQHHNQGRATTADIHPETRWSGGPCPTGCQKHQNPLTMCHSPTDGGQNRTASSWRLPTSFSPSQSPLSLVYVGICTEKRRRKQIMML